MNTKLNISACSWVRKELKIKGKSLHDGRGVFECFCENVKREEVIERVKVKLNEWVEKNMIEKIKEDENSIVVVFKDLFKDEYYRMFDFKKTNRCSRKGEVVYGCIC